MKGKLEAKRLQGRGGWSDPQVPNGYLSRLLRECVDKGDPVDVANLAMMIHQRKERIAPNNEGASSSQVDALTAQLAQRDAQVEALTAERDALRADECDPDGCAAHISAFASQVDALTAQLAQRDAALKTADELALALEDCQGNGGIPINILGYSPAQKLDAAQSAYREARGQDETAKG